MTDRLGLDAIKARWSNDMRGAHYSDATEEVDRRQVLDLVAEVVRLRALIAEARYEHSTSSLVDGQELCDGCHEPVPCMTATILSRGSQGAAEPSVMPVRPERRLPPRYGACSCDCHISAGVHHVAPCCYPPEPEPWTDPEPWLCTAPVVTGVDRHAERTDPRDGFYPRTREQYDAEEGALLSADRVTVVPDRRVDPDYLDQIAGTLEEYNFEDNASEAAALMHEAADEIRSFASGVLGVPADQRTADRETIAQAIDGFTFSPSVLKLVLARSGGTTTEGARRMADAVLAVLVPADQVRAEAWDEGYDAGSGDEAFDARGLSTDPDASDHPHSNPYRKAAGA